jgi:hypothetical protein
MNKKRSKLDELNELYEKQTYTEKQLSKFRKLREKWIEEFNNLDEKTKEETNNETNKETKIIEESKSGPDPILWFESIESDIPIIEYGKLIGFTKIYGKRTAIRESDFENGYDWKVVHKNGKPHSMKKVKYSKVINNE